MHDRRQEIEAKKAKLAELRRARGNRQKFVEEKVDRRDVDELVKELLQSAKVEAKVEPVQAPEIIQETKQPEVEKPVEEVEEVVQPAPVVRTVVTYTKSTQTEATEEPVDEEPIEEIIVEPEIVETIAPVPIKPTLDERTLPELTSFVEASSKVLERALDEYIHYDTEETPTKAGMLRRIRSFPSKKIITSIDWSPKFPGLVLASYKQSEPGGVVHVWNMHMNLPEFTFRAQSDVTCARFSPFHSLIVGGTFSGQITLWDMKSDAVQQTKGKGHSHPIVSLNIVGTQNANNIVSTSSDGVVCVWTVDMLAQPQEVMELVSPPPSRVEDISPMCVSFSATDSSVFMAGSEEGLLYSINRQDRAGSRSGVDRVYRGHTAPITSVDHHPSGPIDYGLVLTGSLDWSIRLWRRDVCRVITTEEAVYDLQWSPVRAGTFACVVGKGCYVYDLVEDMEMYVVRSESDHRSLGSVRWSSDGRMLACGGLDGELIVYDVSEYVDELDRWYRLDQLL